MIKQERCMNVSLFHVGENSLTPHMNSINLLKQQYKRPFQSGTFETDTTLVYKISKGKLRPHLKNVKS